MQNTINPDDICRRALQAKMDVYQAKESFETILKNYNDQVENLINVIGMMKSRILELESQAGKTESASPVQNSSSPRAS
ncbi:hypothetical protein GF406_13055 [candidate division KSB1 bacterium]|nr:hypothetical protein [candidate division KSB1 bacterium]